MGYKTLEVTVTSAKDIKNVNLIGKMDVYVVVHLSDEPKNKQKTPVHQDGGTNPSWNYTMRFTVDEAAAAKAGKYLVFQLKHEQTFGSDKELGEVLVPLRELFDSIKGKDGGPQFATYQVRRSSGKAKGELKFSYKFIDMGQDIYGTSTYKPAQSCSSSSSSYSGYPPSAQAYPPPAGYPAPHQAAAAAYPPPHQASTAYPPPPQQVHAANPPPSKQEGHATYPPAPQQAPVGYPLQSQQPAATGVPYAAPQGYPPYGGYPPQPAGYGYPPQGWYPPQGGYPSYPAAAGYGKPQKPQKPKNNFGMGLGAGLLGGAIGGLVLGEVMDDAFDGGFDGGFDF